MDKRLLYYNYEEALRHFEERLLKIKQGSLKRSRLKIVAKPVLLLAVLKAIDCGKITCNRIEYDDVKEIYEGAFRTFFMKARQENLTPMYYPWYYMKTDEFWKLAWKTGEMTTSAPGEGWIKRYVDYAFLDDDLWVIAQNHEYRHRLMDFLVEHKIVAYVNEDAGIAAEGLSLKEMLVMMLAM